MKENNKTSFIHLFILFFFTIGTRTIIERKFGILEAQNLSGVKLLIVDLIYFVILFLAYYLIYDFIIYLKSKFSSKDTIKT